MTTGFIRGCPRSQSNCERVISTAIMEATYKDLQAVRVESGRVSALFLHRYGGKLASLRDRESGREFLAQAPGEHYRTPRYGGDYTEFECSGFDDMFPTIDPVCCMQEPWKGVEMPDHGEVYALPWDRRDIDRGFLFGILGGRVWSRLYNGSKSS